MKYADVPELNRPCSRLALGSMAFDLERMDHWWALLDAFVDMGGNCIDTARSYRGGESETVIGRWLSERNLRDDMIVLTKGAHPKQDGLPRVRPEEIDRDVLGSLESLQVDVIDLYVLHRDDVNVPVGELVDCLNEHLRAGRIRAFGGSNWTVERLQEANEYAQANGITGFAASSPNLSLAQPKEPRWAGCISVSNQDLDWYQKMQMPLFSWSSQAGGFFTGRFTPEKQDNQEMVRVYYSQENWDRYERAQKLGRAKGVDAIQIALAYVLCQPFPTFALIGPVTTEELRSSAPGLDVDLSEEELRWLDGRSGVTPNEVERAG